MDMVKIRRELNKESVYMKEEPEKAIEREHGLKFYKNIPDEEVDEYIKLLNKSRCIGIINTNAYDRNGKPAPGYKGLYLKNGIEIAKFNYVYNHPDEEYIDLSKVSNDRLLVEINFRLNKELVKND